MRQNTTGRTLTLKAIAYSGPAGMQHDYHIRTMSSDDIECAIEWAAAEGWNPGAKDADGFASVDPQGFFGGWLGDRMIASISVVNYDASFAFLGFYITQPAFRGRGYGYRLWQSAIRHAGARLIGLDGVVAEQANYARSGFRLAHRNIRFGGAVAAARAGLEGATSAGRVSPVSGLPANIASYDQGVFPAPRPDFLRLWFTAPGHIAMACHRDMALTGYAVARPCRTGVKIGPLFADDAATARSLLWALLVALPSGATEMFLDVPEPNAAAMALARDLGLAPVFETARMYTGPAPGIDLARVFGITSFELG